MNIETNPRAQMPDGKARNPFGVAAEEGRSFGGEEVVIGEIPGAGLHLKRGVLFHSGQIGIPGQPQFFHPVHMPIVMQQDVLGHDVQGIEFVFRVGCSFLPGVIISALQRSLFFAGECLRC